MPLDKTPCLQDLKVFDHPVSLFNFIRMYDTIGISPFPESFMCRFLLSKTLLAVLCIFPARSNPFQNEYLSNHPNLFFVD